MDQVASRLTARLQGLTNEQLNEVERFVEGLESSQQDRVLSQDFGRLSEPVFAKIWDNDEDDAYDAL